MTANESKIYPRNLRNNIEMRTFYKLVDDFVITQPDLWLHADSRIQCAALCVLLTSGCKTFVSLNKNTVRNCQLHHKKGTCTGKDEVFTKEGSLMFQIKVRFILHVCLFVGQAFLFLTLAIDCMISPKVLLKEMSQGSMGILNRPV
jgi:hypothetical protein